MNTDESTSDLEGFGLMQSDSDLEGYGLMQSDDTTIESDAGDNNRESLDSDTYDRPESESEELLVSNTDGMDIKK